MKMWKVALRSSSRIVIDKRAGFGLAPFKRPSIHWLIIPVPYIMVHSVSWLCHNESGSTVEQSREPHSSPWSSFKRKHGKPYNQLEV